MDKDRRSHPRHMIGERSAASLSLSVDGRNVPVLKVHDISPLGIGLLVAGRVENGSAATLSYRFGETELTVAGSIAWNLIDGAKSLESSVGIYFDEKQMELNMEFFIAITAVADLPILNWRFGAFQAG